MGSTGSGSFGTYKKKGTGNGNGIGGGTNFECPAMIEDIKIEDVATSDYYLAHQNILPAGETVRLRNKIHDGRLVVESSKTKEIIGNLPTSYNYLLECMENGFNYSGLVKASGVSPIPFIVVTLNA